MATRYGRAGGNWSAAGTWAASSGGGSDGAGLNAGDDVVLDANSSGTFTIDTSISIATLDCTGFTGTLTHNGVTLTVTGLTFKLVAGMTYTATSGSRLVNYTGTGTLALTSAGKSFGSLTINSSGGGVQQQDALTVISGGTITLTLGTHDCNNFNCSAGIYTSANTNTKALIIGASATLSVTASGTVFDFSTSAGNFTPPTNGAVVLTTALTTQRNVILGTSKTWGCSFTVINSGSAGWTTNFSATTATTIAALNITAPAIVGFSAAVTYNITAALALAGTSATNVITLLGGSTSTATAVACAGGSTIAWGAIGNLTFTGSPVATNSFNLGGNSGITITGPASGGGARVIGG